MDAYPTYRIAFATKEESQYLRVPRDRMTGDAVDIPLEVASPCFHKVVAEPAAYCFSGKGGSAIPGSNRVSAV